MVVIGFVSSRVSKRRGAWWFADSPDHTAYYRHLRITNEILGVGLAVLVHLRQGGRQGVVSDVHALSMAGLCCSSPGFRPSRAGSPFAP